MLAPRVHTKPSGVFERLSFLKGYPVNSKLLGALAVATAFGIGGTAEAGHGVHFGGHFGGSVHVGGGGASFHGSAHIGVHYARPGYGYRGGYRGYGGARGHIYVGPSYGYYYRPYYAYGYPEYVPSYYGASYYPVQPTAQLQSSAMVVAPRPELPRFGIGLSTGATDVNSKSDSGDIGILGRFRLTDGLLVEGELGKTTYTGDTREDRRLGASLVYEIGAYNRWAPYVVGGLGVQQAQVGTGSGDYSTTQDFAEIGVGLRWAISPQIHIMADIRAGSRNTVSNDTPPMLQNGTTTTTTPTARSVAPPTTSDANTSESYTRARLAAVLYF
jgi:hypothetical protein